jgi:hypothetical protein
VADPETTHPITFKNITSETLRQLVIGIIPNTLISETNQRINRRYCRLYNERREFY